MGSLQLVSSLSKQPRGWGPRGQGQTDPGKKALIKEHRCLYGHSGESQKLCGQEGHWGAPKYVKYWGSD